jgi:TonB-linked SusC/RagA family outer membrane protein
MRRLLNVILLFFVTAVTIYGQQKTIKGTVLDDEGLPLPGATVLIEGTNNGVITDLDGNFSISAEPQDTLKISFIGFNDYEVFVGANTELSITLESQVKELQQVVVTALGIKREKKALGYSVQDVKSEDLNSGGNTDVASALQGKVAGVQISAPGSGVGGSSRIVIRGSSSLSDNNRPLIIVDGVPFNSSSTFINTETNESDEQAGLYGGTETSGGLADINPEDIESVSVLKGPNAAALYGSRAGNGVILITTKNGKKGKKLSINVSSNVSVSELAYSLDLQNQFGQGSKGVYDPTSTTSWGPEMNGQMLEAWTGETIAYSPQSDRLKDFTRNGVSQSYNVSVSSGNENGSFRASFLRSDEDGIYEGHNVQKSNFDLNATYALADWLDLSAKASYFNTEGHNRPEMGFYSYISYFNRMPANIRTKDLTPGYELSATGDHIEKLYASTGPDYRNPYFLREQTYNSDERNRGFGYVSATIRFLPSLKLKLKEGLDFYHEDDVDGYRYADNANSETHPNYNTGSKFFKEENSEFLLSYDNHFGDLSWNMNIGGNRMYTYAHKLNSQSGKLPTEGYYFLGYGTKVTSSEDFREQETQSLYAFTQLGYKNRLFLDITGRNDWSSTLPEDNNSYFYPSFSLSGIISDMIELPAWFSFAKVRTSWAQVGKATEPYMTNSSYTIEQGNFSYLNGNVPTTLVNKDLKPEMSNSFEVGSDLRFLNNRIGLDFTYYDSNTKNQIMKIDMDQSTGYSYKLINAGLIENKGFEFMLSTKPVKSDNFNLELNFNFASNTTTVEELDEDLKEYKFGDFNGGASLVAVEGEKMGDIKGLKYQRNNAGNIIVDSEGLPIHTDEQQVIGNIQPDWTGSVNLRADYKGFYLSTLISMQQGGDIYSASEQAAMKYGTPKRTASNNRAEIIVDGVTTAGSVNTTPVSAEKYWTSVASVDEEFIYDASYMKMSEIALGYNLPKSLLSKVPNQLLKSARISLVGRNLFYFYKHTPGTTPDASAYSSGYLAQAFDFAPVPGTRTYGFTLNLGF